MTSVHSKDRTRSGAAVSFPEQPFHPHHDSHSDNNRRLSWMMVSHRAPQKVVYTAHAVGFSFRPPGSGNCLYPFHRWESWGLIGDTHLCCLVCPTFFDDTLKLTFISTWLLYNAVLVSTVQQSGSAICLPIPSLFFGFPFHLGHPRAIEEGPLSYAVGFHWLSKYQYCVYASPGHFCPEMELVCPTIESLPLSSLSPASSEPSYQAVLSF